MAMPVWSCLIEDEKRKKKRDEKRKRGERMSIAEAQKPVSGALEHDGRPPKGNVPIRPHHWIFYIQATILCKYVMIVSP